MAGGFPPTTALPLLLSLVSLLLGASLGCNICLAPGPAQPCPMDPASSRQSLEPGGQAQSLSPAGDWTRGWIWPVTLVREGALVGDSYP